MKLSIIIPVYDEEETIVAVLKKVDKAKLPKGMTKEIIVVNDGSKDDTLGELLKCRNKVKFRLFLHAKNCGKGAAVVTGIKYAKGDIVLIQDADLEYDPKDYYQLVWPIMYDAALVVYGNRFENLHFKLGERGMHLAHYIGNRGLTFITNLLFGSSVHDMEVGYKVMRKEVAESLRLRAKSFDLEPEITAKLLKQGIPIYQVPIKFNPRGFDEGKKISWVDGIKALYYLIKYRIVD